MGGGVQHFYFTQRPTFSLLATQRHYTFVELILHYFLSPSPTRLSARLVYNVREQFSDIGKSRARSLLLPETIEKSQSSLVPKRQTSTSFLLNGYILWKQINERISDCGETFDIRVASSEPTSSINMIRKSILWNMVNGRPSVARFHSSIGN